jgi:hypothetical protein
MLFTRRFWLILFFLLSLSLLSSQIGTAQPAPVIILLEPGEGSKVISPMGITAQIYPGGDRLVRITLIDQQNNVLSRKLLRINSFEDTPLQFQTDLSFGIPKENSPALLTLAIQDEYHRPQSLRSVTLTLQSAGQAAIQPSISENDWLTITQPTRMQVISGGSFLVSGRISPLNNNPVVFELMTESGSIIGTSQLDVPTPRETFDFEINLSYDFITHKRDVRLIVRQWSSAFASNVNLDSLPVILLP